MNRRGDLAAAHREDWLGGRDPTIRVGHRKEGFGRHAGQRRQVGGHSGVFRAAQNQEGRAVVTAGRSATPKEEGPPEVNRLVRIASSRAGEQTKKPRPLGRGFS